MKIISRVFFCIFVLFCIISIQSASSAQVYQVDKDIVMNSQVIQIFQLVDAPNVLLVVETKSINNTGTDTYDGTILLSVKNNPMYVSVNYSRSENLNTIKLEDDLFSVEVNGNYSLEPGDSVEIIVQYQIGYPSEEEKDFLFNKEILYETRALLVIATPVQGYIVEGNDIDLQKATTDQFTGSYYSPHDNPIHAQGGDEFSLRFRVKPAEPSEPRDDYGLLGDWGNILAIGLFLIIVGAGVGMLLIARSKKKDQDYNKSLEELPEPERQGKKSSKASSAKKTKSEKAGSTKKSKLLERKKTVLTVLKDLEKRYESGDLPEDIYTEMKNEYKKEAIEIMKKIDSL